MVSRQHPLQGRQGAVDHTEVRDLGHPLELFRSHLLDGGEDGHHRVVDPDVDGPEAFFHEAGGPLDRAGIGDVRRDHQRLAARSPDLVSGAFQAVAPPGDEPDARFRSREAPDGGAAHPGRRAGDHDHFRAG